jgi:hypothetical protein
VERVRNSSFGRARVFVFRSELPSFFPIILRLGKRSNWNLMCLRIQSFLFDFVRTVESCEVMRAPWREAWFLFVCFVRDHRLLLLR